MKSATCESRSEAGYRIPQHGAIFWEKKFTFSLRVYFGFIVDKTTVFLCAVFAGHTELFKTPKKNIIGSLEVILEVVTSIYYLIMMALFAHDLHLGVWSRLRGAPSTAKHDEF